MKLPFLKMHGCGNDFIIFDARKNPITLTTAQIKAMSERRLGIGCDQVIIMEPSKKADVFMRIFNSDGGQIDACGNATRCIAWLVMEETNKKNIMVETKAGLIPCDRAGKQRIRADMGEPRLEWKQIPLSEARNTLHLGFNLGELSDPVAVSMGNPHAVFIVRDCSHVPVSKVGPMLEHYPLFPERANISFAEIISDTKIKLRVWERGAGETLACGTAACATLVALNRRGLVSRNAEVLLPGGAVEIAWEKNNRVTLTGDVALSFEGELTL